MPLGRRYKTDRLYHLSCLPGECYTDTLHGRTKSKSGNKYVRVFANNSYFAAIYPINAKKKVGESLRVGFPERLTMDGAPYQVGHNSVFMKEVQKQVIDLQVIEHERHNQNPIEGIIQEIRRKWFQVMFQKKVPEEFWDYGM